MVRSVDPDEAPADYEEYQQRLARLNGEVLQRYRGELKARISDPSRLAEVYGTPFATSGYRRQAALVAEMAAKMLKTKYAGVHVITRDRGEAVASYGTAESGGPVEETFCQNVIGTGREFAVDLSQEHPLVCDTKVSVRGKVVTYLGVPIARNGYIVGVLCVYDDSERHWDIGDVSLLTQMAAVLTRATSGLSAEELNASS